MPSEPFLPPDNRPESNVDPATPTPLPRMETNATFPETVSSTSLQTTDSGLTPNVAAGLAVLLTLITGLIFLFLEKRNQFVRFWAMQAVFFGAAAFVIFVISAVISFVLGHILWVFAVLWGLFSIVIYLGLLVVWIIMLIQAFSGKEWEVPFLGKIARQQLNVLPKV